MTKKLSRYSGHQDPVEGRGLSLARSPNLEVLFRSFILALGLLLAFGLILSEISQGKSKSEKFHGTVVNAGPKAITVKSKDNIYLVRTFNYAPELEKKVRNKPPQPGKRVTVRYLIGTQTAVDID